MREKHKCAIAAGNALTVEAGKVIFELGGNAFDAAIAATLAAFVTEPTLTSAGGGGFLLAHTSKKRNILFDFFTQTPRQKRPLSEVNFYPIDIDFGDTIQSFHIGLGSIATPGNLAGLFAVHQHLGSLPFKAIAEPAIEYAERGITLSAFQDTCINQYLYPILLAEPLGQKLFAPSGCLVKAGDRFYMKNFAATLREISCKGVDEFYRGEIARKLVTDCRDRGGYLTREDLENYRVIQRQPLTIRYRDYEIITNPPPSSGGTLIAFALKLLETIEVGSLALGSPQYIELLARAMQLTNVARKDGYNANLYDEDVAEKFLSPEHLALYQQQLTEGVNRWGSTTHISTIDDQGNAASITTSNGEGSAYIIPGTDIMVNNMLGEEDLNPSGFHQWPCDRRMSSMMSPTLILQNGNPLFVLGSGGSNRIRTAILQVIINLLDFQLPLEVAVANSRVHWENNLLNIEPPFPSERVAKLQLPNETEVLLWKAQNMFFGGVHAVGKAEGGWVTGAGDPRREGAVAGVC
ncbi:gamma-glutamyltransferase [Oscillatoria sp. FACHB-1406]|uniref:gamma-glutamyltransferase n=1 Tax=Oscillatoria sp. FACHB-1406 TaxID=2692846 RepID=UPI0016825CE3|nr:gamma-glutamyltransferase [Oscillatoria sp. FACHB-1406]